MVTIQEAEERWEVSGRTIRRRLSKGVSGASRTPDGQWLIPTSWLDQEFRGASSATTVNEPVIDSPEPVIDSVIDMTPPVSYDNRPDMSSQLEAKDARIDHLRDQIADLRVEMAGITVEQKYAQIAEKRVTAERDRANSDLEQARSEAERLRMDLTGEQAARTAEAAAAEAMTADKDQEIERQRTKMGELRRELRLAEDQSKRRYRRAKQKEAKRKAKASRKA